MNYMFPGEKLAMDSVESVAREYGYGRVIQVVQARWAIHLKRTNPEMTWASAALAAGVNVGDLSELELEEHIFNISAKQSY